VEVLLETGGIERKDEGGPIWENVSPATLGKHYFAPRTDTLYLYMYAEFQVKQKFQKVKWKLWRGWINFQFWAYELDVDQETILCVRFIDLTVSFVRGIPVGKSRHMMVVEADPSQNEART
jgi:hypothetical protein